MRKHEHCQYPGCVSLAGRLCGYCAMHAPIAKPCIIENCTGRVAAWSKSGCCSMHVLEGRKMRP